MKAIVVKTIYHTDESNNPIPEDVPYDQLPVVYHGPFSSFEEAERWMRDIYPDGDEDVYDQFADEFDINPSWLNDPTSIDEDIRPD